MIDIWSTLTYKQIFELKDYYICYYEVGIRWVSSSGWYPIGFRILMLNWELIVHNPLNKIISEYSNIWIPILILKWNRKLKGLSFSVVKKIW